MKIALLADTHYGNGAWDPKSEGSHAPFSRKCHKAFATEIHSHKPDVLLVAGDLADTCLGPKLLSSFFKRYKNPHGASLFVPGNHDVWCYKTKYEDGSSRHVLTSKDLPDPETKYLWHESQARENGWVFLKDEPWHQNGVYVVGNMGWYDFSTAPPELGMTPERYEHDRKWSDYVQMGFTHGQGAKLRMPMTEFCKRRMAEFDRSLEQVPDDRKALVVATHIVGFKELMGQIIDYSTAFFGNLSIGRRVSRYRADLYFCGHSHAHVDAVIQGVRCINNGSGYGKGTKRYDVLDM